MYYDYKNSSFLAARFVVDRLPIEPRRARALGRGTCDATGQGARLLRTKKCGTTKLSVIESGYAIPAATRESRRRA